MKLTNYELRLMIDQLSDSIINWHDDHTFDDDDDLVRLTVVMSKLEDELTKQQAIAFQSIFQKENTQ
tara:strand:- start:140 stop:340 length:201 start_codon:yes stop_codon:yes gene_type:complete